MSGENLPVEALLHIDNANRIGDVRERLAKIEVRLDAIDSRRSSLSAMRVAIIGALAGAFTTGLITAAIRLLAH